MSKYIYEAYFKSGDLACGFFDSREQAEAVIRKFMEDGLDDLNILCEHETAEWMILRSEKGLIALKSQCVGIIDFDKTSIGWVERDYG